MHRVTRTITIAGLALATLGGTAHADPIRPQPLPPEPIRTAIHKQSFNVCFATDRTCTSNEFRHIFRHAVKSYWIRIWDRRNARFTVALRAAASHYGVSYNWLYNCAQSEGGVWEWRMNRGGSGAGGWMQFMSSTFYAYVRHDRVRRVIPAKYRVWNSRVGQAYTSAYMFSIGESHQWTGAGC